MQLLCLLLAMTAPQLISADAGAEASALAGAAPEAERSILDSGFSRTATYLMKTAMKLPPHILPTLNELNATMPRSSTPSSIMDETTIGFYVPGKQTSVGVYMPKSYRDKRKRDAAVASSLKAPTGEDLPERERRTRKQRPRRRKKKNRIPEIPFDPKHPMNILSSLGSRLHTMQQIRKRPSFMLTPGPLRKERERKRGRGRKNIRQPPPRLATQEPAVFRGEEDDPYSFQDPNFSFPASYKTQFEEEELLARGEDQEEHRPLLSAAPSSKHRSHHGLGSSRPRPRRKRKNQQVGPKGPPPPSKYVPNFVKVMLANAFLKNPNKYINKLKREEQENNEFNDDYLDGDDSDIVRHSLGGSKPIRARARPHRNFLKKERGRDGDRDNRDRHPGNNRSKLKNLHHEPCLLYTSPSPRDRQKSRMPSSA